MHNSEKIMISACLLGSKVRYDGSAGSITSNILDKWLMENRLISICPEILAGASVPRNPAEISSGNANQVLNKLATVFDIAGNNVTMLFIAGAEKALQIAQQNNIRIAILKERSPSCGSSAIYNGTFTGQPIPGMGVTTALLRQNGITVFNEHEITQAAHFLKSLA